MFVRTGRRVGGDGRGDAPGERRADGETSEGGVTTEIDSRDFRRGVEPSVLVVVRA